MKTITKIAGVIAALTLVTACASSSGPDVDATAGAGTNAGAGPSGPVPGTQGGLEASAGHQVFFAYDQYTLTPSAQATLAKQAAWLQEYPETRIKLDGNCDERGTREYNLALGARRAEAARSYLVSLGVDSNRITTVSYGKERPGCTASNESCWAKNRNATTTIESVGA